MQSPGRQRPPDEFLDVYPAAPFDLDDFAVDRWKPVPEEEPRVVHPYRWDGHIDPRMQRADDIVLKGPLWAIDGEETVRPEDAIGLWPEDKGIRAVVAVPYRSRLGKFAVTPEGDITFQSYSNDKHYFANEGRYDVLAVSLWTRDGKNFHDVTFSRVEADVLRCTHEDVPRDVHRRLQDAFAFYSVHRQVEKSAVVANLASGEWLGQHDLPAIYWHRRRRGRIRRSPRPVAYRATRAPYVPFSRPRGLQGLVTNHQMASTLDDKVDPLSAYLVEEVIRTTTS